MSERYSYVAYNPYGVSVLNTDGNQANVLYRLNNEAEAQALVAEDPEHYEHMSTTDAQRIIRGHEKSGGNPDMFPIPYMEK